MSGSATFATARFRFATAATRISEARTSPARGGLAESAIDRRVNRVAADPASPSRDDAAAKASRESEGVGSAANGRPRVVVLGGGFAGLGAARKLKHAPVD